jgi:two-component system, chemotaxis family, protein-glutamate methylesterase/glutaminase
MGEFEHLIVIGASTGGMGALRTIFSGLPADFPAPILVVMHIGSAESILPTILASFTDLPVRHAANGSRIEPGTILIAPSDCHLLVEDDCVRLSHGPKENHARPAIDPLFRSAAIAHDTKVIGVILTGNLDDGVVGLQAVKDYGGLAIVQDPDEAEVPSMPQNALDYVDVDYCLKLDDIAVTLMKLVRQPRPENSNRPVNQSSKRSIMENRFISGEELPPSMEDLDRIGTRSVQTCPECGGTLWEINDSVPVRYRCHTGHAFTGRSLLQVQHRLSEDALWSAVRALHEKHTLLKRLASEAQRRGAGDAVAEHEAAAELAMQYAEALRKMINAE